MLNEEQTAELPAFDSPGALELLQMQEGLPQHLLAPGAPKPKAQDAAGPISTRTSSSPLLIEHHICPAQGACLPGLSRQWDPGKKQREERLSVFPQVYFCYLSLLYFACASLPHLATVLWRP